MSQRDVGWRMFALARYRGTLIVTDAERFALAMEHGIGPAKAFGFGLMVVG